MKGGICTGEDLIYNYDEINIPNSKNITEAYGEVNINGKRKIQIKGNEGAIPHFHIVPVPGGKNDDGLECCMCLGTNKYFKHGSKQGKLDKDGLKALDAFLREKPKKYKGLTRWEAMCIGWNAANDEIEYHLPDKQPDYTKTKDTILEPPRKAKGNRVK